MPDIEFAFLADSAQARPGEKFHVLGGGVSRLASPQFPFSTRTSPSSCDLSLTAPETGGSTTSASSSSTRTVASWPAQGASCDEPPARRAGTAS